MRKITTKPALAMSLSGATLAMTLLAASGAAAASADAANGEKLYKSSCMTCHDTSIHTREDKIIFSKKALRNRVEFCEGQAGARWTPQQMDDVTEYLNKTFYKYDDK